MHKAKMLILILIAAFLCYFYYLGVPVIIYLIGRAHQYKIDHKVKIVDKTRLEVQKSPLSSDQSDSGGVTIV